MERFEKAYPEEFDTEDNYIRIDSKHCKSYTIDADLSGIKQIFFAFLQVKMIDYGLRWTWQPLRQAIDANANIELYEGAISVFMLTMLLPGATRVVKDLCGSSDSAKESKR